MRPAVFLVAVLSLGVAFAHGQEPLDSQAIQDKIAKLRSMPDAERAKITKQLALAIRALPASMDRAFTASSLTNLATEGDFGRDTLQEVTTTLSQAVADVESPSRAKELEMAYEQLAALKTYEGMTVNLTSEEFQAALAKQAETDAKRAKADFTLKDIQGKTWTLSQLKGKVVLVNFWATWCPPCRKEMPDLDALYKQFKPKGFVILAISNEKPELVSKFIHEKGYTYPMLIDPTLEATKKFEVGGIPKSFLYDRSGKLVGQTIDMRTRKQFLALLAKAGLK